MSVEMDDRKNRWGDSKKKLATTAGEQRSKSIIKRWISTEKHKKANERKEAHDSDDELKEPSEFVYLDHSMVKEHPFEFFVGKTTTRNILTFQLTYLLTHLLTYLLTYLLLTHLLIYLLLTYLLTR